MSRSPNVRRRRVRVVLSPRAFWLSPVKPTQPSHTAHETGCLTFAVGACACRSSAACLLAGALAYLLHAAVNVNQPITTPLLFLFLSASVSAPTEPTPARKNPRAQRAE